MQKLLTKQDRESLENTYQDLIKQMSIERDIYTLKQYNIIKKAWEVGKQIDITFTRKQLAIDLGVSYSTVKRLLTLQKMSMRTEKLIKDKKISLNVVAEITSTSKIYFEEEVVDIAIENNYTTYDIQKMDINNLRDLDKYKDRKMKKAEDEGYTRKFGAYMGFSRAINNMFIFLNMPLSNFPEVRHKEIKERTKSLSEQLNNYTKTFK